MKALVYHGPNNKAWEEVAKPTIVDDKAVSKTEHRGLAL